ncbi:hypothetical protein J5N97_026398 [Dioscorea zingiberensis]|uniref:Transcription factor CBF/NF-Y/archaeal histone domain-containing protein n=1 Tax=Dioscorea zingiberensis TaxID=325984 RepID=A0A9D5C2R4_9LILI|nr:hypothetical protein J5N97_026398 [Dioscorea zingiberensis]
MFFMMTWLDNSRTSAKPSKLLNLSIFSRRRKKRKQSSEISEKGPLFLLIFKVEDHGPARAWDSPSDGCGGASAIWHTGSCWGTLPGISAHTTDFKNHSLPLARIKKIMKADEDVRMIAAEAPVVFARACEMFILELTHRSWAHAEENKRRTLQKNDIAAAITRTDVFDFLVDIVPREEGRDDVIPRALGAPAVSHIYI